MAATGTGVGGQRGLGTQEEVGQDRLPQPLLGTPHFVGSRWTVWLQTLRSFNKCLGGRDGDSDLLSICCRGGT